MHSNKISSEIELREHESGRLWPYYQEQKAWSSSSLTDILKKIEYVDKQIPEFVLQRAAQNGKLFHQTIQDFIQENSGLFTFPEENISSKVRERLKETINFLEQNKKLLNYHCFLGSERLHYTFYKKMLIATYTDLEFTDCIVELKTNNIIMYKSPLILLTFQIQLLIQHLCTKKDVYLLWSTGSGVIFHKFKISKGLLKILDILIDLVKKGDHYSLAEKRNIIEKMLKTRSFKSLTKLKGIENE